jgi:hypothetical protein
VGDRLFEIARGRILTPDGVPCTYSAAESRDGPRVLALTHFDPGAAAYRYHSAANTAPGGRSAFVRYGHDNPHCDLRQWDGQADRRTVERLFDEADVIHVHMDYATLTQLPRWPSPQHLLVRHYHGASINTLDPIVNTDEDRQHGAVQIGARLYHRRFSKTMHWLPIPVPVRDYATLARLRADQRDRSGRAEVVRIAHSATNWRIKGSVALQHAVMALQQKGLPVELVSISNVTHGIALAMKATCDITFDSFWLGIQGSGLEGAAMGHAVIAGDPDVKAEYENSEVGYCPYTYARDFEELIPVLERLVVDPAYRAAEAARVNRYVREWHDYPIVGRRYWNILDGEMQAAAVEQDEKARTA